MMTDYRSSIMLEKLPQRILNGKVLIRVFPDEYLKVGNLMLGDIESVHTEKRRYQPVDHAIRYGEVVLKSSGLSLSENITAHIEVEVGDLVWFDFHSGMTATLFEIGKCYYYLLDYASLIVRKRGDEIYPLNGKVLCEPVIKKKSALGYEEEYVDAKEAIVKYVGQVVEHKHKKAAPVKVGDRIITRQPIIFLENDLHLFLDGNKYRFVSIFNIEGVYEKEPRN